MAIIFVCILAALGAAIAFRGRWMRGLIVILVANATAALTAAATGRWGWVAFSCAMCALSAIGMACARRGP